ncbi:MAG: glycosyltransferase family 39 protein [Acidobacteria bacterium]|nr:glycosyltransferase family 39 protein [Acidobacteriota bacterium]
MKQRAGRQARNNALDGKPAARPSEDTERTRQSYLPYVAAVFAVALAARAAHLLALRSTPWLELKLGDASTYDAWARQIASGDWMSGTQVFYQAPLYPYFLAVLYKIAGSGPLVVRGVQAVLGSVSCVLVADAGAQLFSPVAGLIAGLILALYPPAIFHDLLVQKSVLDLLFMCAALSVFSRIVAGPQLSLWFGLGLSIGCLALTRENAIVLLLPIGAWLVLGELATRAKWVAAAALAVGLACPLVPVAARNWAVSRELHLTTSQFGPNFYIGNNPRADGTYRPLVARRARAVYERAMRRAWRRRPWAGGFRREKCPATSPISRWITSAATLVSGSGSNGASFSSRGTRSRSRTPKISTRMPITR